MEVILTDLNFVKFVIMIGFPILVLKIISLLIYKILSFQKIEDFFKFAILSIVEIIISTIYLSRTLISPDLYLVIGVIFYILSINLLILLGFLGFDRKNDNWGDFWFSILVSSIFWFFMMFVININYFI